MRLVRPVAAVKSNLCCRCVGANEVRAELLISETISDAAAYSRLFLKRNYSVDMVLLLQYRYYWFLRPVCSNSCQG